MRQCGVAWPVSLCGPEPPAAAAAVAPRGRGPGALRGAREGQVAGNCSTTHQGKTLDIGAPYRHLTRTRAPPLPEASTFPI